MSILSSPLPADLPTNWTNNQIVSPDGTSAGLTQQHGYNYLMQQVNNAQSAINQIDTALSGGVAKIQAGTYVGTGTHGIDNPNTITLDFAPKIVFCAKDQYATANYSVPVDTTSFTSSGILLVAMLSTEYQEGYGFSEPGGQLPTIYSKKSSDGKTIYWYGNSAARQNNKNGTTYYWLAIG